MLAYAEEQIDAIINSIYNGVVVLNSQGIITIFNPAAERILGVPAKQALGIHIEKVVPDSGLYKILKGKKSLPNQKVRFGDYVVIADRALIMQDEEIKGAISVLKDITELEQIALELESTKLGPNWTVNKGEFEKTNNSSYHFDQIIGKSELLNSLKARAFRVAQNVSTVLITGESGTGKELFAHSIHNASERRNQRFIKVNCAAIPDNLLESELFGYVEGAFTGARKGGKPGKLELADGGTVFLDEIGDMPIRMQAKMLRVLQEKEVERIGGLEPIKVDIRVIAATNQNLKELIQIGNFREDLYYRLNIIDLQVPPLREHPEDIPDLADFIIKKLNKKLRMKVKGLNAEAIDLFKQYRWPGNVRELENLLELAMNLTEGEVLRYDEFPCIKNKVSNQGKSEKSLVLFDAKQRTEKQLILDALDESKGDKKLAARILAIHPSALYRKIKKYGIA